MSECTGPDCAHPEHVDPTAMPAWQRQRLPTHAGDWRALRTAAEIRRRQEAAVTEIRRLFGTTPTNQEPNDA